MIYDYKQKSESKVSKLIQNFDRMLQANEINEFRRLNLSTDERVFDYCLKKNLDLSCLETFIAELEKEFSLPNGFQSFGVKRKIEYILSRLMIRKISDLHPEIEEMFIPEEYYGGNLEKQVRGSISHHQDYIRVCLSLHPVMVGIDIESTERLALQGQLWEKISTAKDREVLRGSDNLRMRSLLFSAKESLYKFAYPKYQKYFGFQEAHLIKVNESLNELTLASNALKCMGKEEVIVKYRFQDELVLTLIQ